MIVTLVATLIALGTIVVGFSRWSPQSVSVSHLGEVIVGAFYIRAASFLLDSLRPKLAPAAGSMSVFSLLTRPRQPLRMVRRAGQGIDRVLRVYRV